MICRKEQYVIEKHNLKRKIEEHFQHLIENASVYWQKLPKIMNDEWLKTQTGWIVCIANEVKYHRSYYLNCIPILKMYCNEVVQGLHNQLLNSYKLF